MGTWGYSKRKDALDKMEAILRRMEEEYEETQEADVRPNTVSYVTVSCGQFSLSRFIIYCCDCSRLLSSIASFVAAPLIRSFFTQTDNKVH